MGDSLKSTGHRRVRAGWIWPLALLALPMCTNDFEALLPSFFAGNEPRSGAIMCDIPKVVIEGNPCANESEAASGMPMSQAAVNLNLGERTSSIVLDFSDDALAQCNGPRKVEFHGPFPDGHHVCLNCVQQMPSVYATPLEVCIAVCKDLIKFGDLATPPEGADAYCTAKARLSTNFNGNPCIDGLCTTGGNPIPTAADPRRNPEDLIWTDPVGDMDIDGNTLAFVGTTAPDLSFSAGAASEQLITTGDAWVEFAAGETGVSHVIGVRASCDNITVCPDEDGTLADIPVSLSLNSNGEVNVVKDNAVLAGPFGLPYEADERFRIYVVDRHDNTADIVFSRLDSTCDPDEACLEDRFYTYSDDARPTYPIRVDATFREGNASLANVTLMRIK